MDFKQLSYYLEVCRLRSFSKAAKTLFLSQQGLSKSIKSLEDELGAQLFTRLPTGIELTANGELLREYAVALLQHHDQIVKQMRSLGSTSTQVLTIGYSAGCFDLMPPDFLSDYMRLHPEVDVHLKSFYSDQYQSAVLNYNMDISLCPVAYDANLFDSLFTFKRRIGILMAEDHPLAKKDALFLEDFRYYKTGFLNAVYAPADLIAMLLQKHGIKPNILLTPAEMILLRELASRSGVAFFFAGRMELMPENLICRRIEDLNIEWEYNFITNKNAYITQATRSFVEYAKFRLQGEL